MQFIQRLNRTLQQFVLPKYRSSFAKEEKPVRDRTTAPLLSNSQLQKLAHQAELLESEIFSTIQTNEQQAGEQASVFLGRGIEFEELRRFQPGDNSRDVDWHTTLRRDHPYVKIRREERRACLHIVIDRRSTMRFATRGKLKVTCAAELALLFVYAGSKTNARIGISSLEPDKIQHLTVNSRQGIAQIINAINAPCPPVKQGNKILPWDDVLQDITSVNNVGTRVILLSDFNDLSINNLTPLAALSYHHQLTAIRISDPAENNLPDFGPVRFHDSVTGQYRELDTGSKRLKIDYLENHKRKRIEQENLFRRIGVNLYDCTTTDDAFKCLRQVLQYG